MDHLGPYASLAIVLIPFLIVEPLKLVALLIAGNGHWLIGTTIMIVAYALSLLVVERLFRLLKPNLIKIRWLASALDRARLAREKFLGWLPNMARRQG
jgi:hypothetical protein